MSSREQVNSNDDLVIEELDKLVSRLGLKERKELPSLYDILGIRQNATQEDIENAYSNMREEEKRVEFGAYKILSNGVSKDIYDNLDKEKEAETETLSDPDQSTARAPAMATAFTGDEAQFVSDITGKGDKGLRHRQVRLSTQGTRAQEAVISTISASASSHDDSMVRSVPTFSLKDKPETQSSLPLTVENYYELIGIRNFSPVREVIDKCRAIISKKITSNIQNARKVLRIFLNYERNNSERLRYEGLLRNQIKAQIDQETRPKRKEPQVSRNYYQILGLRRGSNSQKSKQALSKILKTDIRSKTKSELEELVLAATILTNPLLKLRYDEYLKIHDQISKGSNSSLKRAQRTYGVELNIKGFDEESEKKKLKKLNPEKLIQILVKMSSDRTQQPRSRTDSTPDSARVSSKKTTSSRSKIKPNTKRKGTQRPERPVTARKQIKKKPRKKTIKAKTYDPLTEPLKGPIYRGFLFTEFSTPTDEEITIIQNLISIYEFLRKSFVFSELGLETQLRGSRSDHDDFMRFLINKERDPDKILDLNIDGTKLSELGITYRGYNTHCRLPIIGIETEGIIFELVLDEEYISPDSLEFRLEVQVVLPNKEKVSPQGKTVIKYPNFGYQCRRITQRNSINGNISKNYNFMLMALKSIKPLIEEKTQALGLEPSSIKPILPTENRERDDEFEYSDSDLDSDSILDDEVELRITTSESDYDLGNGWSGVPGVISVNMDGGRALDDGSNIEDLGEGLSDLTFSSPSSTESSDERDSDDEFLPSSPESDGPSNFPSTHGSSKLEQEPVALTKTSVERGTIVK